jgi:hypothetical protein
MKIQLIDRNKEMCEQWKLQFNDCNDVIIHNGDFFSLKTDCVVSPANSFGFMNGALDLAISKKNQLKMMELGILKMIIFFLKFVGGKK